MGKRCDHIATVKDLRDRCRVDDVTGCWHFGRASADKGKHAPSVWCAALGRTTSLGGLVGYLLTGEPPVAGGSVWHRTCKTMRCANPAHRTKGTMSGAVLSKGYKRTADHAARLTASLRGKSKVSPADAEAMRGSTETLQALADRYGISISYVSQIRLGRKLAPSASRASSVFAWAGGAA